MSARQLIVSADDAGLTEGHNRAIAEAHLTGILTSASLLACGAAFDDAVVRVRDLPITPEKIWRALQDRGAAGS